LATLSETINTLAEKVSSKAESLDDALFSLQTWIDQNAGRMTEADREGFSETLNAEKETATREGKPYGDDLSLVLSVLRLHAMRLLYRFDERREGRPAGDETTPYNRARYRLTLALREAEMAINEARVDTAIANAHHILADHKANHRWLQDALTRLDTIAQKDLIRLAEAVPAPENLPLNVLQRIGFRVLGIKQEEIARRNLQSLRQVAELQTHQLIEMAKLLADSFDAIGDQVGARQALALVAKFGAG
jgi:hypothetical protein